jgi:hypothetical protein
MVGAGSLQSTSLIIAVSVLERTESPNFRPARPGPGLQGRGRGAILSWDGDAGSADRNGAGRRLGFGVRQHPEQGQGQDAGQARPLLPRSRYVHHLLMAACSRLVKRSLVYTPEGSVTTNCA